MTDSEKEIVRITFSDCKRTNHLKCSARVVSEKEGFVLVCGCHCHAHAKDGQERRFHSFVTDGVRLMDTPPPDLKGEVGRAVVDVRLALLKLEGLIKRALFD